MMMQVLDLVVVGRISVAPSGKMPDGDFVLSGLREFAVPGRVSIAPPGKQCLMTTSSYQAYEDLQSKAG
ncbi:hypothetical protein [Kosakonia cowanii]|uniref:hypothetical protein n=1 Tax=Kosakonia cowanii TaxID=208223 RepID=UPI0028AB4234|nr:hypothetical protein [Kosakonia cowanii]